MLGGVNSREILFFETQWFCFGMGREANRTVMLNRKGLEVIDLIDKSRLLGAESLDLREAKEAAIELIFFQNKMGIDSKSIF